METLILRYRFVATIPMVVNNFANHDEVNVMDQCRSMAMSDPQQTNLVAKQLVELNLIVKAVFVLKENNLEL